jgi:hypothetical protein
MRGEVPGQDPNNDIFNRKSDGNQALVPTKFKQVLIGNGYGGGAGYHVPSGAGVSSETVVVNGGGISITLED